jgi:dolichol kinase
MHIFFKAQASLSGPPRLTKTREIMYSIHALLNIHLGSFYWVPMVIFFILTMLAAASLFRWYLLRSKGFDLSDREMIFSNRETAFSLEHFLGKYSSTTLKVVDGIPRKTYHFFASAGQIFIGQLLIKDIVLTAQTFILANIFIFSLALIYYRSNVRIGVAGIIYGGTNRIRDGRIGRLNSLVARSGTILAMIAVSVLGMQFIQNVPIEDHQFMILLIYIPVVIGDAMGEIVGSFWGRHEFKVIGIGAINRKSIEGSLAVFLSTAIVLGGLTLMKGNYFILGLSISIISTLVEAYSPRSTDNFLIPLVNSLVLCLYFNFL